MKVANSGIAAFQFFEKKVETSDPFDLDIRIDIIKQETNHQEVTSKAACTVSCGRTDTENSF